MKIQSKLYKLYYPISNEIEKMYLSLKIYLKFVKLLI